MSEDNPDGVETSIKRSKIIFGVLNVVIWILSIAMISLMISLEGYWEYYEPFLNVYSTIHSFNVIFAGGSVIIATVLGFIISYTARQSHFIWYGTGMLLIIFLELKILIIGFTKSNPAKNYVAEKMYYAIRTYNNKSFASLSESMDFVQMSLKCCGVFDMTDWFKYEDFKMLPNSCCSFKTDGEVNTNCTFLGNPLVSYPTPCLSPLVEMPELGMLIIYSFVTMLICFEILNILMASTLFKKLKYS